MTYQGHPDQHFGHITYSQHGEDLMICNIFQLLGIDKPSYLDLGAHHPMRISNTHLLYLRGSRGVNVETNPNLMAQFFIDRPEDKNVCIGVSPDGGDLPFYMWDSESGRNTFSFDEVRNVEASHAMKITKTVTLATVTLDWIVDNHCDGIWPDFLSCDLEGVDYQVLAATDFLNGPKVVCVESRIGNDDIYGLMASHGYRIHVRMGENLIFVKGDLDLIGLV